MYPIALFLELTIEAQNMGRQNAKQALEFLTELLNEKNQGEEFYSFVNPASYYPEPNTRIAKIFEDCYQLFRVQRNSFPNLIRILIFFKGKIYDNFLIRLDEERGLCEIEDIDISEISNRGIASICLNNLEKVLAKSGHFSRIIAGLAPRDYEKRKHLYHFYSTKNGFIIKREVTRNTWGLVEKVLKS